MILSNSRITIFFISLLYGKSLGYEFENNIYCFQNHSSIPQLGFNHINADCSKQMLYDLTTVLLWADKNISTLDVSHNYIEKIPRLPVFDKLKHLNLKDNNIKFIEERALSNLRSLEFLDLSFNFLTGSTLRADVLRGNFSSNLYEPLPIKILLLGFNRITSLNANTFEHLPNLRELQLSGNPLKSAAYDSNFLPAVNTVTTLEILSKEMNSMEFYIEILLLALLSDSFFSVLVIHQILDLAKTGISSLACQNWKHLALKKLYINGNKFTTVPDSLHFISSLEFININENPIEELNIKSFFGLVNLKEIVVSGMPNLTAIKAGTFTNLPCLETLKCSYNPELSYIDEEALSTNPSYRIKSVILTNNKLRHLPINLLRWSQLDELELDGNPWSCDCKTQWLIDFDNRGNKSLITFDDLICREPYWLNGTPFSLLAHPFGKLMCDEMTKVKHEVVAFKSFSDIVILLAFTAFLFFILGIVFLYYVILVASKSGLISEDLCSANNHENRSKYIKLEELKSQH